MIEYDIRREAFSGDYVIIRFENRVPVEVQFGLKTAAKAEQALRIWREREEAKHAQT